MPSSSDPEPVYSVRVYEGVSRIVCKRCDAFSESRGSRLRPDLILHKVTCALYDGEDLDLRIFRVLYDGTEAPE